MELLRVVPGYCNFVLCLERQKLPVTTRATTDRDRIEADPMVLRLPENPEAQDCAIGKETVLSDRNL